MVLAYWIYFYGGFIIFADYKSYFLIMDELLDKDGNTVYNCTGYLAYLKANGIIGLKGMKEGDQINVSTYQGSERMVIAYFQDNHIFCDCDGIERCVALQQNGDTLLFVDRTDN
jgi:hypothetical protein